MREGREEEGTGEWQDIHVSKTKLKGGGVDKVASQDHYSRANNSA